MRKVSIAILAVLAVSLLGAAGWMQLAGPSAISQAALGAESKFEFWEPLVGKMPDGTPKYDSVEKVALIANVFVALAGLGYALLLVGQVRKAPDGTPRMQEIARAI